jgi:branched-chain amino acid transport system permease protein
MDKLTLRSSLAALLLLTLALVPVLSALTAQPYYITLFSRILIFGLAALGLNLILGYGGMISFGHALYLGIGAYAVGILSSHGIHSGWIHLAAALAVGLVSAVLIGSVCLRTTGMAFIMITLAFTQMLFFLAVSLRKYGGDDGLAIQTRSDFALFSLADNTVLYYTIFAVLLITMYAMRRIVPSRFGMVLRGCKSNERRMIALGFPTFRYRLAAYVLSAIVCVVAGVLLANLTRYVTPSYMQWQVSGELIVMIVLGGMGTLIGPIIGSFSVVLLEEILGSLNFALPWGIDAFLRKHFLLVIGVFIVLVALTMKQGLYGYLIAREQRK